MQFCELGKSNTISCQTNFSKFLKSPPNEKGDALAGIAGSLAFLWIIVTVLLQSNELALQRDELKQTRTTLQTQTMFLKREDEVRTAEALDRQIEGKIENLEAILSKTDFSAVETYDIASGRKLGSISWINQSALDRNFSLQYLTPRFVTFAKNAKMLLARGSVLVPPDLNRWETALEICEQISLLKGSASPTMQDKLEKQLEIRKLANAIELALSDANWATADKEDTS